MADMAVRSCAPVITPLSGVLGAKVDGIDLRNVSDEAMQVLRAAFLEHCILIYPGQQALTPAEQVAFAARWGEVHHMLTPEACLDGNLAVLVLDFKGRKPPTDKWHSDVTMEVCPPMATFLLGRTIPIGGDTIFANQYLAYETLSDGMRRMLDGLNAVHDGVNFAKAGNFDPSRFPSNLHPVVRTHPETGRKALFVNLTYTRHFEGMTIEESQPLLDWLYDHSVQPNFTFRHRWTEGDLMMWDNRCLQHFAVADYGEQTRVMHRVTVLGDRPR